MPQLLTQFQIFQPAKNRENTKVKKTRKAKRRFNFIDDEAGVSGDDTDDEDISATQGVLNIIDDVEEDDPSVDMQARYLQSVRLVEKRHVAIIPIKI